MDKELSEKLTRLEIEIERARPTQRVSPADDIGADQLIKAMETRAQFLAACVCKTVHTSRDLNSIVRLFLEWMQNGTVVRVIGAGRARLAAAIPANRLAHGGARVFVQDDIIPMPHTIHGGGIIAASASGETTSVLHIMEKIRYEAPHIVIVGVAESKADHFREMCDHFIGITYDEHLINPLSALADAGEYVISEVLDALVVAAGHLGGFDERRWRMGHENIGATGPYDARIAELNLLFNERY